MSLDQPFALPMLLISIAGMVYSTNEMRGC